MSIRGLRLVCAALRFSSVFRRFRSSVAVAAGSRALLITLLCCGCSATTYAREHNFMRKWGLIVAAGTRCRGFVLPYTRSSHGLAMATGDPGE